MNEPNSLHENFSPVEAAAETVVETPQYWGMSEQAYCMLLHLAQYANAAFPWGGIILPLIMWQANKDKSQAIDEHGKHVMNWLISELIYMIALLFIGVFLFFVLFIGIMIASDGEAGALFFPLMFLSGIPYMCFSVVGFIFPIIGAVKANKGECWKYPLTIRFIK